MPRTIDGEANDWIGNGLARKCEIGWELEREEKQREFIKNKLLSRRNHIE